MNTLIPEHAKVFAQAIGAALQQPLNGASTGSNQNFEVVFAGTVDALKGALLIAAGRKPIEPSEAKALGEALSKSADPRALSSIDQMAEIVGEDVANRQKMILERDLARNSELKSDSPGLATVSINRLFNGAVKGIVLRFVSGLEKIALKNPMLRSSLDSFEILGDHGVLVTFPPKQSESIYKNRLWDDAGLVMGQVASPLDFSAIIDCVLNFGNGKANGSGYQSLSQMMTGIQAGQPVRIRLGRSESYSRSQIWTFAELLSKRSKEFLSDGRMAHWDLDVIADPSSGAHLVVLFPKSTDDQRFLQHPSVQGGSQATIAAALVEVTGLRRIAGIDLKIKRPSASQPSERVIHVWDPFCGGGTELRECSIAFDGVESVRMEGFGTDLDPKAIEIARKSIPTQKVVTDSKIDFVETNCLSIKESFDIIVTNPPFGMRTNRGEAREILEDFLFMARQRLRVGGVLVLLSHAPSSTMQWAISGGLKCVETHPVRLGKMQCEIQRFEV